MSDVEKDEEIDLVFVGRGPDYEDWRDPLTGKVWRIDLTSAHGEKVKSETPAPALLPPPRRMKRIARTPVKRDNPVIRLPKPVVDRLGLRRGGKVEWCTTSEGEILVRKSA